MPQEAMTAYQTIQSLRQLGPLDLSWPVEKQNFWWGIHCRIAERADTKLVSENGVAKRVPRKAERKPL